MPPTLLGDNYSVFYFFGEALFLLEKSFNLFCNKSKVGLILN